MHRSLAVCLLPLSLCLACDNKSESAPAPTPPAMATAAATASTTATATAMATAATANPAVTAAPSSSTVASATTPEQLCTLYVSLEATERKLDAAGKEGKQKKCLSRVATLDKTQPEAWKCLVDCTTKAKGYGEARGCRNRCLFSGAKGGPGGAEGSGGKGAPAGGAASASASVGGLTDD